MFEQKLWELVRGEIRPHNFEQWVYANPTVEQELGPTDYLTLLEYNFSNVTNVFRALESWSRKMYGAPGVIDHYNQVIMACKKVLERDRDFVLGIRELIATAPEGDADWDDEDWRELLLLSDYADIYPIGVEDSLVREERRKETALFDSRMRQEGQGYCEKILVRYGKPPQKTVSG